MLTTIDINGNNKIISDKITETPAIVRARDEVIIRRKNTSTDSRRDQLLSRAMNIYARSRGIRLNSSNII